MSRDLRDSFPFDLVDTCFKFLKNFIYMILDLVFYLVKTIIIHK